MPATIDRSPDTEPSRRAQLSPWLAAGLLLLIVLLFVVSYQRNQPPSVAVPGATDVEPVSSPGDDVQASFAQLSAVLIDAVRKLDTSAVESVTVPDSPVRRNAVREIRELSSSVVTDKTSHEQLQLELVSRQDDIAVLREIAMIVPCFVNSDGKDITSEHVEIIQTAEWTLHLVGNDWMIFDAEIVDRDEKQVEPACA